MWYTLTVAALGYVSKVALISLTLTCFIFAAAGVITLPLYGLYKLSIYLFGLM